MERTSQQQTVVVDRGLFLIRYSAAKDATEPPTVRVSAASESEDDVQFILCPDQDEPVLWEPESCLVVRAEATAKLAVDVIAAQQGGSTAATVRIEPLNQGKAIQDGAAPRTQLRPSPNRTPLRILGHLTGIGDVIVNPDEWLGGPSIPLRIEGVALQWPGKPDDLAIRYAVKTARPQPISGRAMELGSFAGTRGKAMPIVGLMLEVSGPDAENYEFAVETIFLGSQATRTTGKRIIVSGPTGREPLVGLRIDLIDALAVRHRRDEPARSQTTPSNSPVRVFRSKVRQTATA